MEKQRLTVNYHYNYHGEDRVKSETMEKVQGALKSRRVLQEMEPLKGLPMAQFAVTGGVGERRYTGLVAVELRIPVKTVPDGWLEMVCDLSDDADFLETFAVVRQQSDVVLAFADTVRNVLTVVVAYTLVNNELPTDEGDVALFHENAYLLASQRLALLTGYELLAHNEGVERQVPLVPSSHVWMNTDASPTVTRKAVKPVEESVKRTVLGQSPKRGMDKEQQVIEQLMDFLPSRYEFRRNDMTGSLEYRQKGMYILDWQPVTNNVINTIIIETRRHGINAWDRDVRRYLESNFVQTHSPITDYLYSVRSKWDGEDHVAKLAARVPNSNPRWPELFHRWMLSAVSQWLGQNKDYGSTQVPLLVGAQGDGKSTFCRMLLPPHLRYLYTDRLDFANKKDAERALSAFALINIDEFDSITKSQTAFLKHVLQKTNIMGRDPYAMSFSDHKRYAAFIATTNCPTPLIDPTGSRRYICVRTTGRIDNTSPIDYDQLYAQLAAELFQGERAYFDSADEKYIQQCNMEFQDADILEDVFNLVFTKPASDEDGQWMSVAEIVKTMRKCSKAVADDRKTHSAMGRILSRLGFRFRKKTVGNGYIVALRTQEYGT